MEKNEGRETGKEGEKLVFGGSRAWAGEMAQWVKYFLHKHWG